MLSASRSQGFFRSHEEIEIRGEFLFEEDRKQTSKFARLSLEALRPLLPFLANRVQTPVSDLRGRPAETFSGKSPEIKRLEKLNHEELFFLKGGIYEPASLKNNYEDISELELLPISFQLLSHFETFQGSRHIVHQLSSKRSGILEQLNTPLSVHDVTRTIPLSVESLRFGFEFFRSRRFGSLLGRTPAIAKRLYFELDLERCSFHFRSEIEKGHTLQAPALSALLSALEASKLYLGATKELRENVNSVA